MITVRTRVLEAVPPLGRLILPKELERCRKSLERKEIIKPGEEAPPLVVLEGSFRRPGILSARERVASEKGVLIDSGGGGKRIIKEIQPPWHRTSADARLDSDCTIAIARLRN